MDNINAVGHGVGQLRVRDTQVAHLLQGGVSVQLLVHVGADTADVAHMMKDSTRLRHEEQQCQT
jgi:hypothetical protein